MYAPEALEDLKKIKANIIENFDDEELTVRSLRKLMDNIDILADFPYMGEEVR